MDSIYHFYYISDKLACSGQPTEEQLTRLATLNYTCIINLGLLHQKYSLPDESSLVQSLGMRYIHLPVSFENPTMEDLQNFLAVMSEMKDEKILVHCAANYRASCFLHLYLFYTNAIEAADIDNAVLNVWQPNSVWQHFMEEGIRYINHLHEN